MHVDLNPILVAIKRRAKKARQISDDYEARGHNQLADAYSFLATELEDLRDEIAGEPKDSDP